MATTVDTNALTQEEFGILKHHLLNKIIAFPRDADAVDRVIKAINHIKTRYMAMMVKRQICFKDGLLESIKAYLQNKCAPVLYGMCAGDSMRLTDALNKSFDNCTIANDTIDYHHTHTAEMLVKLYQILDADFFMHSIADKVDRIGQLTNI